MPSDYQTILSPAEFEADIKKSRFIGRVHHVTTEAEAEAILAAARKEHYKATHVCWAYVLGIGGAKQKASDDGEPSGTAGKPILEVINARGLTDVLVLVIRYFGGIKLGAGGLIRAYSGSAAGTLDAAQTILRQYCARLAVTVSYHAYGPLTNLLEKQGRAPAASDFSDAVTLTFDIPVAETDAFTTMIREATDGRFTCEAGEAHYVDVALEKHAN
jgi:uncharacterized YigZ family protein